MAKSMWAELVAQLQTGDLYGTGQVLCYAESVDALNWRKVLSEDCMPYKTHRATNIVNADETAGATLVLNHDRRDPSRKFLLIYEPVIEARKQGVRILSRVAASPDGLHWTVIAADAKERRRHGPAIWDEAGFVAVAHLGYRRGGAADLPALAFHPANLLSVVGFTVV